jgi:outer membrane receptor protein involved in Fe transport
MKHQASLMYPRLRVTLLSVGLLWPGSRLTAQAAPTLPAPAASAAAGVPEVVQLSPFEVTADNRGYQATTTMSGTRLNSKLEDLASAMSVVTKEQMADFALLDLNDVFNYEAGTEGTGNYTDVAIDRNGMAVDNIQNNPQGANRIRGMGPANITFNNFSTTGRVPVDTLNIDALEISRGPNSSIFGIGEGAGHRQSGGGHGQSFPSALLGPTALR